MVLMPCSLLTSSRYRTLIAPLTSYGFPRASTAFALLLQVCSACRAHRIPRVHPYAIVRDTSCRPRLFWRNARRLPSRTSRSYVARSAGRAATPRRDRLPHPVACSLFGGNTVGLAPVQAGDLIATSFTHGHPPFATNMACDETAHDVSRAQRCLPLLPHLALTLSVLTFRASIQQDTSRHRRSPSVVDLPWTFPACSRPSARPAGRPLMRGTMFSAHWAHSHGPRRPWAADVAIAPTSAVSARHFKVWTYRLPRASALRDVDDQFAEAIPHRPLLPREFAAHALECLVRPPRVLS